MQQQIVHILRLINEPLGIILLVVLLACALWFTFRTRAVQWRMFPEMLRLLFHSTTKGRNLPRPNTISSFSAFIISLGSRVGTGNIAGVATAIAIGGPGAIFWMWVMALLAAVNGFIESTLAQLFKVRHGSTYIGGPAYYILKGMHSRTFAYIFAITLILDFGLTNNMVQSNTITVAFQQAFNASPYLMAILITFFSLLVIFGGIQRISRVCSFIVPFMAIAYIAIALYVVIANYDIIPHVFNLIIRDAFGFEPALGGGVGTSILIGFKRGLFSNEAGEGSTPNAAAVAETTHPVKQGLIQALGVYTDTLVICTATAFIILCSGLYVDGPSGVELTQLCLESQIGPAGRIVIAIAILFFAFSSIVSNYYYGECNLLFMTRRTSIIVAFRILAGALMFMAALSTLDLVWGLIDIAMAIMALVNIVAMFYLGRYAIRCLDDYCAQRKQGKDPVYHSSTIPEIASETECWADEPDNQQQCTNSQKK